MTDKTIAELREWGDERPDLSRKTWDLIGWKKKHDAKFEEILSRAEAEAKEAKADEPLAVLAYRKGFHNTSIWPYTNGGIEINLRYWEGPKTWEVFTAPTYLAAEAKARAYLSGLKDVKQEEENVENNG